MAGSARYTAVLDANVLYPSVLRDLLISLAVSGLYYARWSEQINLEWTRNLKVNRPDIAGKVDSIKDLMNSAVPDCLVENYEALIPGLNLPDPDDRHVLATAIAGHADAIVTINLKDFPTAVLANYGIKAIHPDEFIANQFEIAPTEVLVTIKMVRSRMKNPPIVVTEFLEMIRKCGLPQTAQQLERSEKLL